MSCDATTIIFPYTNVTSIATTPVLIPVGGWRRTGPQDTGRAQGEMLARTEDILVAFGIQFANDPYNPGNTYVQINISSGSSGFMNANGIYAFDTTLTTLNEFQDYRFWRPVLIVKNSLNSTRSSACVGGTADLWHA